MNEPSPTIAPLDATIRDARRAAVDRALSSGVGSVYQPIVDLHRGAVVGFEALARCEVPTGSNIGDLFAQAESIGRAGDLEAAALRSALRARSAVPDGCFLSLNVGAAALATEQVREVLDQPSSLEGVVLELGADPTMEYLREVSEALDACRDKGASVAVAQSRLDLAGIESLLVIEPDFVKLGLDVVGGVSTSNVKLAVVDSLRHLADTLGVGVIAQGVEELADMESLRRLGIGFGQGYLFAAPAQGLQLETRLQRSGGGAPSTGNVLTVGRFVEVVDELTEDDFDAPLPLDGRGIGYEVLVSELREPVAMLRRVGRKVENVPITVIAHDASVADVVRTALGRPMRTRFEPFVCVDEFGACLGVVRLERLMTALLDTSKAAPNPVPTRAMPPENRRHRQGVGYGFRCVPRPR